MRLGRPVAALVLTLVAARATSAEHPAGPGAPILTAGHAAGRAADGRAPAPPLEIARDGASRHAIVLEASASPSERSAAAELRSHLKACTGAELPIVTAPVGAATPMIVVGRGPTAERLGVRPTLADLGEQGCAIRTVPPHLVIAGTAAYGTLFGARDLLERELGVRWFAPDATRTPRRDSLELPAIDRIVRPAFLYRSCSYGWPGGDAWFLGRRGLNAGRGTDDDPQGLRYAFDGTCHTYFTYVDPAEHFDAHPELFSEIGGVRIREETQLCLTDPRVLEIVAERMLRRMREDPGARQHNFSQMDWYNPCECARCLEVNRRYGTAGGTQFWFVDRLAERTSAEFPRKLIGTLAYTYTEEPPRGLTLHPNVAVWLCHMFPSCDSHPIESCPRNAEYRRRAEAWSRICSHLYAWHYVVNFAHYYVPFPNLRALARDLRFYRRLGFEGVFAQASGECGELSLLRGYLVTELLEDPERDAEALVGEFLEGYYGPAADPVRRYIALLHDKVARDGIHMHLYTNPAQGYLTDEVLAESGRLFDRAEAAVEDDPALLERVRVARMPLVYAAAFPRNGYVIEGGILRFRGPLASPDEVGEFMERMRRHGFGAIRELDGAPEQMAMTRLFHAPMPLVVLENGSLRVEVAPLLGGRALRVIDRRSGRCLTAHGVTRNLYFPFSGGEESRVGEYFAIHAGGGMSQFRTVERTERSVTLEAGTANGFAMTRKLVLADDRPALTVELRVTNPSERPRSAQLHAHLSLGLGQVRETRVRFESRDGRAVEVDMAAVVAGLREGSWFRGDGAPAEAWTFSGPDGFGATQRFAREQVASAWLVAYPEEDGELEAELLAPKATLEPGQSVGLAHTLEVHGVR